MSSSITQVAGIEVGHYTDTRRPTGCTVVLARAGAVAGVDVRGAAPGTRETDLLRPGNLVEEVHAVVLSGGSAFGLEAATGVMHYLHEQGIGVEVAGQRVPIVPAAILFDLANGGDKDWGRFPPYRELGYEAARTASAGPFTLGSVGAGTGALVAGLKGGLGSASTVLPNGITVGALVAVNAVGTPTMGDSRHFWAAPFEVGDEFGGLGLPGELPPGTQEIRRKQLPPQGNTTIGIIATDARLTKADAKRLAVAAHDGFTRALWPAHTPLDGDLVFSLATGSNDAALDPAGLVELYAAAGATMARAIARGVYHATREDGDLLPTWRERFGG